MSSQFCENKSIAKQYRIIRLISKGGFGTVFEAINLQNSRRCAIKIIDILNYQSNSFDVFLNEGRILRSISDHRHIVKLYHERIFGTTRLLEMELLEKSLQELIIQKIRSGIGLSETEAREIIRNLLLGLEYLHKNDLVHRDLKPENIGFLDAQKLSSLKIFDFGLSAQLKEDSRMMHSVVGTIAFMAPEVFWMNEYNAVGLLVCGHVECGNDRFFAFEFL